VTASDGYTNVSSALNAYYVFSVSLQYSSIKTFEFILAATNTKLFLFSEVVAYDASGAIVSYDGSKNTRTAPIGTLVTHETATTGVSNPTVLLSDGVIGTDFWYMGGAGGNFKGTAFTVTASADVTKFVVWGYGPYSSYPGAVTCADEDGKVIEVEQRWHSDWSGPTLIGNVRDEVSFDVNLCTPTLTEADLQSTTTAQHCLTSFANSGVF
jgi:hypothetical protein